MLVALLLTKGNGHDWDIFDPEVIFPFFSRRFSLIERLAFFFDSRLLLSRLPFSPITILPGFKRSNPPVLPS
jgi:hypothetical protein